MARWLGWLGLSVLVVGSLAAFVVRLGTTGAALRFESLADPAVLVLVVALIVALALLGASAFLRWQAGHLRRALAAQASGQETERRRFIHRLDHELKNPLTAIQIQLDNLQATESGDGRALGDLRLQADRLVTLTRGLRRLADLEIRSLEIERVEIGELLDEVVELLEAPDRIKLEVQRLPWPVPPIEGDRELLLLAFRNLADNALKYSAGPVQVRAAHTSGHLLVEVIDTGRGIDAAELPLVTEELHRGSNVDGVPGSGLGLPLAQRVVERHGGRLELRSRMGQGTIATVHLPLTADDRR